MTAVITSSGSESWISSTNAGPSSVPTAHSTSAVEAAVPSPLVSNNRSGDSSNVKSDSPQSLRKRRHVDSSTRTLRVDVKRSLRLLSLRLRSDGLSRG